MNTAAIETALRTFRTAPSRTVVIDGWTFKYSTRVTGCARWFVRNARGECCPAFHSLTDAIDWARANAR